MKVHVVLEPILLGTGWIAYLWGKSSPILRPVPGNAEPARRAEWRTIEAAEAELRELLAPAEVEFEIRT